MECITDFPCSHIQQGQQQGEILLFKFLIAEKISLFGSAHYSFFPLTGMYARHGLEALHDRRVLGE
ncbi:hypothetical protein SAMN05421863_102344 [Nitrosomonas communis]|uniref:Uncharacterized protein n=1 Tax=Nitrosomonas communis TaxID=44574 RepID=A0A1I4PWL1_9PROT|nr:hypothetical protein SAMN05421863_102344 [Nitrosomonas communis]